MFKVAPENLIIKNGIISTIIGMHNDIIGEIILYNPIN